MRKIWLLGILALLVLCVLFAVFLWRTPAQPKLSVEFSPNHPWHTKPGQTFELHIKIVNEAQESSAKNVQILVSTPENFTISRTGASECNLSFGTLRGGEAANDTLFFAVPLDALPGNYTVTVRVWADNVPEQTFTPQVTVELPLAS